jgi:endonuclease/exonuclease/phosphatase family metal-dependent hydrolase
VTLRLASYNIRFGGRRRRELIADVLRSVEPDVVVLQEAVDPTVVAWLGSELGMAEVFAEAGRSVAALSRVPVAEAAWHAARPGRSFLELRLVDQDVRLFAVHLSAGLSGRGERRRIVEARQLLMRAAASPNAGRRTILVGDFNAIAPGDGPSVARLPMWIRILLRFDGGIRNEVMTNLLQAGFVDGFRSIHPTEPGFTMPAIDPSVRLDYALIGPDLVDTLRACAPVSVEGKVGSVGPEGPEGLLPSRLLLASDHLPLVTVLEV